MLANEAESIKGAAHDPNAWVVERSTDGLIRLYLRVGESYDEGWNHVRECAMEVAIKARDEFIVISRLHEDQWWQAEFVCPYCGILCWRPTQCSHLMIARHSIMESYNNAELRLLMREMRDREFNCNMLNANIADLKIKVPRQFVASEWFRFAYWYVSDKEKVESVLSTWTEGKAATRYEMP